MRETQYEYREILKGIYLLLLKFEEMNGVSNYVCEEWFIEIFIDEQPLTQMVEGG